MCTVKIMKARRLKPSCCLLVACVAPEVMSMSGNTSQSSKLCLFSGLLCSRRPGAYCISGLIKKQLTGPQEIQRKIPHHSRIRKTPELYHEVWLYFPRMQPTRTCACTQFIYEWSVMIKIQELFLSISIRTQECYNIVSIALFSKVLISCAVIQSKWWKRCFE